MRSILLGGLLGAGLLVAGAGALTALRNACLDRRLAELDLSTLSEHGQRAYERLLVAESVWPAFIFWNGPVEITHRLFDLWDEPEELSTLAFLSQSDPWTFRRALPRYGRDESELCIGWGCIPEVGIERKMIREHLVEPGHLSRSWRGIWSRTERVGGGDEPWRVVRE